MDEQLKLIGERLKGLRDVLDIPVSEMAETIGISAEKYEKIGTPHEVVLCDA